MVCVQSRNFCLEEVLASVCHSFTHKRQQSNTACVRGRGRGGVCGGGIICALITWICQMFITDRQRKNHARENLGKEEKEKEVRK